MEFDILNELLTSSVAQLFTENQSRHHSLTKGSTQLGQDKNIPRQGSGLKDHIMQTPEKAGMGVKQPSAGNASPAGEKLS